MTDTAGRQGDARPGEDEGGAVEALHQADVALSAEAGRLREHPVVEALGTASEISDQPPAFALAGLALAGGLASGRPALAEAGARALAALYLATRTKAAIKSVVVRTRPYKLLEEGEYELGVNGPDERDYNSFPSGHTADAFAAARAIGRVAPGANGPLLGLAALIGLVQVPRATHHLTDVLAGALVGLGAEAAVNAAFSALPPDLVESARSRIAAPRGPQARRDG